MLTRLRAEAEMRQLPTALLTFEPHTREFFSRPEPVTRILTLRDKITVLRQTGLVDRLYVYRFNRQLAQLPAKRFIDEVLVRQLNTRYLLIGDDFRFGAGRAGSLGLLKHSAEFLTETMPGVSMFDQRVSSSLVRNRLKDGDLSAVSALLGRPYQISGRVGHGRKLGRVLGFPTANVNLVSQRPALEGIFAVEVITQFGVYQGMASLGKNPTVSLAGRYRLEVCLFDFAADLYGQRITVRFLKKLRNEERYDDLAQLVEQLHEDERNARKYLIQLQKEQA